MEIIAEGNYMLDIYVETYKWLFDHTGLAGKENQSLARELEERGNKYS